MKNLAKLSRQNGQTCLQSPKRSDGGQALVTLLFFSVIAITIVSTAMIVTLVNSVSSSKLQSGELVFYASESGAENGLLRLLRDPNYAGESMSLNGTDVTIEVTGSSTKTVISTATDGTFTRIVQVQTQFVNGKLNILSWKEVF